MNIDLNFLQRSFSRAAPTYEQHAHMQNAMGARLCTLLKSFLSTRSRLIPALTATGCQGSPATCNGYSHGSADAAAHAAATDSVYSAAAAGAAAAACSAAACGEAGDKHDMMPMGHAGMRVLEIGCGPGNFTAQLLNNLPVSQLCLNDLSMAMIEHNLQAIAERQAASEVQLSKDSLNCPVQAHPELSYVCGNAMELSTADSDVLEQPFDLIVSNAAFQWFSSLPDALQHCSVLAKGSSSQPGSSSSQSGMGCRQSGLSSSQSGMGCCKSSRSQGATVLAFSSFYEGNFAQIRDMAGLSLDYLTCQQIEQAMAQVALPGEYEIVFDVQHQYFPGALELFRSLRDTGVTALSSTPLSAGRFRQLLARYEQLYASQKGVCLTWHPYYVIAILR